MLGLFRPCGPERGLSWAGHPSLRKGEVGRWGQKWGAAPGQSKSLSWRLRPRDLGFGEG